MLPYLLLFFTRCGLHSMRSNEGGIITHLDVCLGVGFEPCLNERCRPTIWMRYEGTIQMIRLGLFVSLLISKRKAMLI